MNIVVFGANGPTGRRVVAQAIAEGHTVSAVTRRPAAFPLSTPRLRVVGADVLDAVAVERVLEGQEAVISALGVPFGRRPVLTYSRGVSHISRAMVKHDVRRLVGVTSSILFDVAAPGESLFFRKGVEPLLARTFGRTVYDDMRRMEDVVRASPHRWTVVRPGGLFDAPAVSAYQVGTSRLPGRYTARADLAHLLVRQVADESHVRSFIDVRTTEGVPSLLDLLRKEAFGSRK